MPMLELVGVGRQFGGADGVHAVRDITLRIEPGEFVAIVGASGSGKSTLLNLLGCLDAPTEGVYSVGGLDTSTLTPAELADLRRQRFGFIFQRYHLLARKSAIANVELPAIYAGKNSTARRQKGMELLTRLGLEDRTTHLPGELSGGQQQRVCIARALMNGCDVILADEPTGALDSASGRDIMDELRRLHGLGHTVVLVTHDRSLASQASRVLEMQDGQIVRQTVQPCLEPRPRLACESDPPGVFDDRVGRLAFQAGQAIRIAVDAMASHRLRTLLSLLGISIGIAAIIAILAISEAAQSTVNKKMRGLLSGRLLLFASESAEPGVAPSRPFNAAEIEMLRQVPYVATASPQLEGVFVSRHGNRAGSSIVRGVDADGIHREGRPPQLGRSLNRFDIDTRSQVALLERSAMDKLGLTDREALGSIILAGDLPLVVVGVIGDAAGALDIARCDGCIYIPASTYQTKLVPAAESGRVDIYLKNASNSAAAQLALTNALKRHRRAEDFSFHSLDEQFKVIDQVTVGLGAVLLLIAGISLVVGGVGMMNMMLVTVAERTSEIGIRMAVGARPSDVQLQFLVEAGVLCLTGAALGVAMAWLCAAAANLLQDFAHIDISWDGIALACFVAGAIAALFGTWPARRAALTSPAAALARD